MKRKPGALTLSEDDRRALAPWAADCAERTLALFEAQAQADARPREAIEGTRAFARGEVRIGKARELSVRAHAAARAVSDPAAVAAARAAGHAVAVAHMAAHARGAAAYAARAAELASPGDTDAAATELKWQRRHASAPVRKILMRLPSPPKSDGPLGSLVNAVHAIMIP